MTTRPVYVGVGECGCGRLDTQLFHVPNTPVLMHPACTTCLKARGHEVSEPRTSADLIDVDGKLAWKPVEPLAHAGKLDLGHGHFFEVALGSDDQLIGWMHTHPDARSPEGMLCQSFCAVRSGFGPAVHQVMCVEPLTLTPSLKCGACGAHGHVTNGRWEPC